MNDVTHIQRKWITWKLYSVLDIYDECNGYYKCLVWLMFLCFFWLCQHYLTAYPAVYGQFPQAIPQPMTTVAPSQREGKPWETFNCTVAITRTAKSVSPKNSKKKVLSFHFNFKSFMQMQIFVRSVFMLLSDTVVNISFLLTYCTFIW